MSPSPGKEPRRLEHHLDPDQDRGPAADLTVGSEPPSDPPARPGNAETPEADAAEQSRSLRPEHDLPPAVGPEVDEYDAVEQSRVVPDDDEYRE